MSERPARSCSSPNELRLLYTPAIHGGFDVSKVWRRTEIQMQIPQKSLAIARQAKAIEKIHPLVKGDEPIGEKLKMITAKRVTTSSKNWEAINRRHPRHTWSLKNSCALLQEGRP